MSKQVAEVLRKSLEAFGTNGENWTQGSRVKPQGPSPFQEPYCCIGTSFQKVTAEKPVKDAAIALLAQTIGVNNGFGLVTWNDGKDRTWPEVKAAYEQSIEVAERGQ